MSAAKFDVEMLDGSKYSVKCGPRSEVETERFFGISLPGLGSKEGAPHGEHLYYMVWDATKRQMNMQAGNSFEEWLDKVEDISIHKEDDENKDVDEGFPTRQGQPSDGLSS